MDYDYKFSQLRTVCQIRTANLAIMWITSISILVAWIWTVLPELITHKEDEDDERRKIMDRSEHLLLTSSLFFNDKGFQHYYAIYTYFAYNDLGPNSILCPANYPYPSKKYYNVCIINLSNLICMWLMFSISLCLAIRDNIPDHKLDEWLGFQNNDQSDNAHNKSWEGEEKEGKQLEGVA
ncbi:1243_t:CDS:2 [Funneliformis mosseae]|uniref:1243_t:CDS:1 n=1 Tax=Funneliformis mosseae TaxID=27381 RepID=A0A9N9GS88_FUNMO|nr:1243_t:CDS:2 [Funneliformis mosseae]